MGHEDVHDISQAFEETIDMAVMTLNLDFLCPKVNINVASETRGQWESNRRTVFTSGASNYVLTVCSPCKLLESIALGNGQFLR